MVQLLLTSWQYYNLLIESFSNVADEISAKLLSSFFECEVLVVVSDQHGFEFKELKENNGQKTQRIYMRLTLLITEKSQSHFKVTLGIQTINANVEKYCHSF